MSIETNPYQTPPDVTPTESEQNRGEGRFWKFSFWSAVGLTCFGTLGIFVRNMPPFGFLVVALILFLHTTIGSRRFRKRAAVGFVCALIIVIGGLAHLRALQANAAAQQAIQRAMQAQKAAETSARMAEQSAKQALEQAMAQPVGGSVETVIGE